MELLLEILPWIQVVLAIIVVGAVLLQERGASLGGAFGASEGSIHYERRGFERTLFKITAFIAVAFVVSVFAETIISQYLTLDAPLLQTDQVMLDTSNATGTDPALILDGDALLASSTPSVPQTQIDASVLDQALGELGEANPDDASPTAAGE